MVLIRSQTRWALLGLLLAPTAVAGLMRAGAGPSEDSPPAADIALEPGPPARAAAVPGEPRPVAVRVPLPPPGPSSGVRALAAAPAPPTLAFPLSTQGVWPALSRAAEILDTALVPLTAGLMALDPTPMAAVNFAASAAAASRPGTLANLAPEAPWTSERAGPATRVLAELAAPEALSGPVTLRTSDDPVWRSLDSRLYRMRTIAFNGGFEVGVSGFLKFTAGRYEMDAMPVDRSSQGLSVDAARVHLAGETDDVRLFVSLAGEEVLGGGFIAKDSGVGELNVLDAYAQFDLAEWVELQVGSFRSPVLFSSGIDDNELLFVNRTYSSLFWQDRDEGVMATGNLADRFDWWVAVQNGRDGAGDSVATTLRASMRVFGEGEAPRREGAYDADLGQTLYLGAAYHDDGSVDDNDVLAADGFYTYDRFSLSGEISEYGSGSLDHRQWSATAAYMIVPEKWEVAVRFEDFGTRAGDLQQIGLNRYLHDQRSRVQLVVGRFELNSPGDAATRVELGVVVSL